KYERRKWSNKVRVVIQRVSKANVVIDEKENGEIGRGFLLLVGVEEEDTKEDVDYLTRKISNLRIFEDEAGKMNLSLREVKERFFLFLNLHFTQIPKKEIVPAL